jgi:hypothetical protein
MFVCGFRGTSASGLFPPVYSQEKIYLSGANLTLYMRQNNYKTRRKLTITTTITGKAVWRPAHGLELKTAMLLKCNLVSLEYNLPCCRRAWQCRYCKKQGTAAPTVCFYVVS